MTSRAARSRCGGSRSSRTPTTCARRRRGRSSPRSPRAAPRVVAWDPVAIPEARKARSAANTQLSFATSPMAALEGADALVVVTEWQEFRSPDFDAIRRALQRAARLRRPQSLRSRTSSAPRASSISRSAAADAASQRRYLALRAFRDRVGARPRARRRRRDARSLLVRRRRADLARSAGSRRQDRAQRGKARRGGQRRTQRGGARRQAHAAVGHRRRRAGATLERLLARGRRADALPSRRVLRRRRSSSA